MAAGMGSRYGGLKQLDSFGPNNETIIDYSVYDAIKSGFEKIVFIIREEFSEDFKINAIKNWKNANCKNMIFNTNTGWSTTQIIQDTDKNVVLKLKANFETCSQ